jgi:preprotein translocase SecE subunit
MFSNKLKSLLAFALVLLLTCSFTVLVHAEDNSNVSSAVSQVSSETASDADNESSAVSNESSAVSDESAIVGDVSEEEASSTPGWLGWAIAGGVILVIALWIFIIIKRNTPLGQKIVKFFKDYRSEIKKVVWLSKQELVRKTGVVLVTIIIACIVLGLLDYAFTSLITLIK